MRLTIHLVLAFVVCVLWACGGATVPTSSTASTQAAIRAAQEVGAERVPQAALHLRYARDEVSDAQRLEEDGEEERAVLVLRRAEADAELAIALARAHAAEEEADAAERQAAELQR